MIENYRRRIRTTISPIIPTKPGEHPKNCPMCRGKLKIAYADKRHGIIELPCPAYGGNPHHKKASE